MAPRLSSWPGIAVRRTGSLRSPMPGHARLSARACLKAWLPGTRPGMTKNSRPAHGSHAIETHLDGRAGLDRLIDHAIALGELEQLVELLLALVGVDRKGEPDPREADRRILGDAERAAEIEIALG